MLQDEIRNYLTSQSGVSGVHDVPSSASLLEAGILDSVVMIDLIAFLEGRYGIVIHEDDMMPENFESIDAIAGYVTARQPAV
jgi:acyl carrier protein